jgi:hypothetical protein
LVAGDVGHEGEFVKAGQGDRQPQQGFDAAAQ